MKTRQIVPAILVTLSLATVSSPSVAQENPNQDLWSSNTGQCQDMIDDHATFVEMDAAYYVCFNNGNHGCPLDPGDHEIYGTSLEFFPSTATHKYHQQTRCVSNGQLKSTYTWTREQCWDADALGEDVNGNGGVCPNRPNDERLENLKNDCPLDGNPCNAATGDKIISAVDFEGVGLKYVRTYHSNAPKNLSLVGSRWMHSYADFLDFDSGGAVIGVITPKGYYDGLTTAVSGVQMSAENSGLRLHTSGSEYVVEYPNGEKRYYDSTGQLDRVEVKPGQFTTFTRDAQDRITYITGPFGHQLRFTYHGTFGKINRLYFPSNKNVTYGHAAKNGNYRLSIARHPNYKTVTYLYEDATLTDFITGITDELGKRFATYAYVAQTRKVTSSEHAGGAGRVDLSYATDSSTVTDGDGRVKTYNFVDSPFGVGGRRLVSTTRNGVTSSRTFADAASDPKQRLISITDELGNTTDYTYDDYHRTSVTNAVGNSIERTIDIEYLRPDSNKVTKITRPSAHSAQPAETTITYNSLDLPTAITTAGYDSAGQPIQRTTTFTYSASGQITQIDGPRTDVSDITTFTYYNCATGGNCGQLETITNALGHVTTFNTYDSNGNLKKETDPNGFSREYNYNYRSSLTSMIERLPSGGYKSYSYTRNNALLVTTAKVPQGETLYFTYDDAHRLVEVRDSSSNKIKYIYESAGNRTEVKTEDSAATIKRLTNYTFDNFGRLDTINRAGAITDVLYDAIGNLTESEDPNLDATQYIYDALNRLTETKDALINSTLTVYDINDMPTQVTAANGATTAYVYDDLGNLESEVSPDRGTITYTHNDAGNVLTETDGRNITATYTYDVLNRVTSISYPDTTKNVTFVYDVGTGHKGRLTSVTDESGSTTWTYDVFGHVTQKSQIVGSQTLQTDYNWGATDYRLNSIDYPSGSTLSLTWSTNKIVSASFGGQSILNSATYDPFGPVTGWTWSNGTTHSINYNQRGEVTSHKLSTDTRDLTYDLGGQVLTQSDAEYDLTYSYDDVGRIINFTSLANNGGTALPTSQAFTFDANGNRTSITEESQYFQYTGVANSNRLASTAGPVAKTLTYDAAGNTTDDGVSTYVYDDRGRLASVNNGAATYVYSAVGERVKKTVGSTTTLFAFGTNGEILGEYDSTGQPIQETIWLNGLPVATKQGSTVYQVHADHLGAPRAVSNGNTVVWRWDSDPFGSTAPDEDPDGDVTQFAYNLRFPGQYYDAETGLHFNYFRDYDASIGRYMQSDPIGMDGGINTYDYAHQNPLIYDDPLGLSPGSRTGDYLKCLFRPEAQAGGECGKKLAETAVKETAEDLFDTVKDSAEEAQQCTIETAICTWQVVIGDDAASIAANGYVEYVELRTKQTLKAISKKAAKQFIPIYNAVDFAKDAYLVYVCVKKAQ